MNVHNRNGFSLVETIVASLILSIGVVGFFSIMSSQKAPTAEADKRVVAALIAKQFLEDLRSKVNAADYINHTGDLSDDPLQNPHVSVLPVNGVKYIITYNVSRDRAADGAQKVDLNITW